MAQRPIFLPSEVGARLVEEVSVSFAWSPGMAPTQKKKNIISLHAAGEKLSLVPLLEVSSKSEEQLGRDLSAFHLQYRVNGKAASIESVFQGSKVFDQGGPYIDIYEMNSRSAKRDLRLSSSGKLIKFLLEDRDYPLVPKTAFYDWIYLNALYARPEVIGRLYSYVGFTDIEFNPARSVNCQARSCATVVALSRRGILDDAVESFEAFVSFLQRGSL